MTKYSYITSNPVVNSYYEIHPTGNESMNNLYIRLNFNNYHYVTFSIMKVEGNTTTELFHSEQNIYGDDITALDKLVVKALTKNSIESGSATDFVEYIFNQILLKRPKVVNSINTYIPGYLADYCVRQSEETATKVIETTDTKLEPSLLEEVFNQYEDSQIDEYTRNQIKRQARHDLETIVKKLETNVKTARRNIQSTLQGHILRYMVSSNTR